MIQVKNTLSPKKFKLLGYPLGYSLSPMIHALFAQQTGLHISYELQATTVASLQTTINDFIATGGSGLNITSPFKELVYQQMATSSPAAKVAGAVNTVIINNEQMYGDNTDGIGLMYDLQRNTITLQNKSILILGAGGSVRGILAQLIAGQPKVIYLFNRTLEKAVKIQNTFNTQIINVIQTKDLNLINPNIIIHAFSNYAPEIYQQLNFKHAILYDLNYTQKSSILLDIAQNNGVEFTCNGIGMLVAQAAAGFYLWHGITPKIEPVILHLKNNALLTTF